MMTDLPEGMDAKLVNATIDAEVQRERVKELARLAAARLRPKNLAQEAGTKMLDLGLDVVDRGKTAVRAHPARTIGLAAIIGAILARGPLLKLASSGAKAAKAKWHAFRGKNEQPRLRWKNWIGKE